MELVSIAVVDNNYAPYAFLHWLTCREFSQSPFVLKAARRKSKSFVSLRHLTTALGQARPARCLPALHALSGCDTTSKIAIIQNFNNSELTENIIQIA